MTKLAAALLLAITVSTGCLAQGQAITATPPTAAALAPGPDGRRITFNAHPLDDNGWKIVAALDTHFGQRLPDGDYWYDPMSGVAGVWGGPALVVLPVGMPLGPVPQNASGGGTGIFVNGRELHARDVELLSAMGVSAQPGRWWVDGQGNFGPEGGLAWGNLFLLARQSSGAAGGGTGGTSWSSGWGTGSQSFWAGGDGNGYNWAMDGQSGCSYANDGGGVIC